MSNSTSTTRIVAFIVLAYALLGAIGLTLAIPPGYASPVFPAAGLALTCVLFFDRRALFGVWLGSVLLNLSNAWLIGTLSPATVAVDTLIASGATIQAYAGCWLVNRRQGSAWRDLEREQDAFVFLLLGGILAALLSPSFGVTAMYAAGIIESAEFLFTWWNWYVGDALGILVFAPLTLCLLSGKRVSWGERRRRIVVPMLLTMSLVWLAFYGTAHWEKQAQDSQLQVDGETIAKRITDRLITHREVLASLCHFIEATPDFRFRQFEQFTRITLKDNPDIFALSFNDLITHDERPAFEKMISGLSPLGPYQITERDSRRNLVRAAARSEYEAVRYIVPLLGNHQAVGYDIHSEPIRQDAIERARALNGMAVTSPIQLVQEQKERVGLLELLPVSVVDTADAGDLASRLIGFAVAVIKIDETIDIATRSHIPAGVAFQLTDPLAPDGQRLLFRSETPGADDNTPARAACWETGLRMGDRNWTLSINTTASYQRQHRPWMAWVVGVAGLMFAALLQILILGMTGRTAVILRKNEEIQERSLELAKIHTQLVIQEKMASVGQLAAGIAHELNNPLNFVSMNFVTLSGYFEEIVEMFQVYRKLAAMMENMNPFLPEIEAFRAKEAELKIDFILDDMPALFRESRRGFERIARIIQSMRDFSHVDRSGDFTAFNINTCIEDTLVIARNEYKYIADVTTDLGDLPEIRCLPEQLNQVFLNLIINSAQAIETRSRPDRGRITIRTWQDETDVRFEIADDGPGIPANIRTRIFEPFFTTKPPGRGTGLGLSICYDIIVEKHKGTLAVHCSESGGSVFSISIPGKL